MPNRVSKRAKACVRTPVCVAVSATCEDEAREGLVLHAGSSSESPEARIELDMTIIRAGADTAIARERYGVAAKEMTKRSREVTKRSKEQTRRVLATNIVAVIGILILPFAPTAAFWPLAMAISAIAGINQAPAIIDSVKRKAAA